MASVQDLYSGIIKPGGGMFEGTGGAGVYDGILPGATGAPSGELTTRSVKTVKIDPYTGQPVVPAYQPGMLGRGQPVPVGSSYLTAAEKALLERQIAQSKTLQAGYGRGITPQVQQTAAIPLPRARPGWAPSTMDLAAIDKWEQPGQIGPGLDDLLGYAQTLPETGALGAASELGKMYAPSPKSGSGGSSSGSSSAGQPVKISTGKTASVGQTYQQGASGSGKPYTYQVQKDGSIKNLTTGRTTAPATR